MLYGVLAQPRYGHSVLFKADTEQEIFTHVCIEFLNCAHKHFRSRVMIHLVALLLGFSLNGMHEITSLSRFLIEAWLNGPNSNHCVS